MPEFGDRHETASDRVIECLSHDAWRTNGSEVEQGPRRRRDGDPFDDAHITARQGASMNQAFRHALAISGHGKFHDPRTESDQIPKSGCGPMRDRHRLSPTQNSDHQRLVPRRRGSAEPENVRGDALPAMRAEPMLDDATRRTGHLGLSAREYAVLTCCNTGYVLVDSNLYGFGIKWMSHLIQVLLRRPKARAEMQPDRGEYGELLDRLATT